MSLKNQAISGVFWVFINLFLTRGASFFATVFLARILSPDDFGLMGMIVIFMGIGTTLINSGLSQSLIRSNDSGDIDYSTIFYTNIGFSFLVYMLIFTIAPFIAVFYEQEVLINIIRVYCLGYIIFATSAIQTAILTKEMKFKELAQYQIPATVISILIGILLAYKGFGIWSLVWMTLVNHLVRSLVFWYKTKWTPGLNFSIKILKKHLNFGYKLMLSSILNTGFKNIYNVIIGKSYALNILGFFERSQAFQHYIVATLTEIISNVSYPLLSKIQNDKEKMVAVFKKIIIITFFIVAPVMSGLAVLAKPLFQVVLGEKWIEAVPFFQMLCVSGIIYPLHFLNINLLKVLGRSDLFLKIEIYKQILLVAVILVAFQYGITGLLISIIVHSILGFFINTHYTNQLIDYGAKKQLLDLLPFFILCIISSGIMFSIYNFLGNYDPYLQFLLPMIAGATFYTLANYFFNLSPIIEVISLIKKNKIHDTSN